VGARRSIGSGLFGDVRGRAFWVVVGCLVCQMGLGFGYVFTPLAGDIIAEFGWTRATYSAARAPQLFAIAAASPLVGALVIRVGARRVVTTGTVVLGIGFVLIGLMQSLWQMYALVTLLGLAVAALGDISVGQLVTRWVDRGRGLALGIVYTGSNLGGWLLVPVASGIATRESWRAAFTSLGLGALAVMLPVALLALRERPPRAEPAESATGAAAALAGGDRDLDLAAAVRTRSFWILAATLFSFFFFFLGVVDCLVLFLTDRGMPRGDAALYFGNALGLGIASKLVLGFVADRIPHKAAMLVDYGLLAISSLLLMAVPETAPMWLFVACFAFATAARDVVYPLIVSYCFGARYMAQIYGALMIALLPGGVLGPIFAAAVHDRLGSYDAAFRSFAAINALAFAALLLLRRERRTPPHSAVTVASSTSAS
jgi:MFS family permease